MSLRHIHGLAGTLTKKQKHQEFEMALSLFPRDDHNTPRLSYGTQPRRVAIFAIAYLGSDFSGAGIEALSPGSAGYESASGACRQPLFHIHPIGRCVSQIRGRRIKSRDNGREKWDEAILPGLGGQNGTLVVDMSNMQGLSIDSASKVATIETGNRLGDVAVGLNEKGRALPHGTCPYIGIGGRSGKVELFLFQAVNTVLANGTSVRVTKDNYPDLLFALRGASPSFGITTSIKVETFPTSKPPLEPSLTSKPIPPLINSHPNLAADSPYPKAPPKVNSALPSSGWYGSQGTALNKVLAPVLGKMPKPDNEARLKNGTYIDGVGGVGYE
ncbi:hypothetical protein PQX77_006228 [Marasmius sp. AFHP31]|nr:hypothetical protein PQX77_006228 [Marasmius sp. AFHP31]